MIIDYEHEIIYPFTEKYLAKNFSADVLSKYKKEIAYLYQNGYVMTGNGHADNAVKMTGRSLKMLGGLKTTDDFIDLVSACGNVSVSADIGDRIISDCLYSVLMDTKWAVAEYPVTILKRTFEVYKDKIVNSFDVVESLLCSKDLSIQSSVLNFKKERPEMFEGISATIAKFSQHMDDEKSVMSWFDFVAFREQCFKMNMIYEKIISGKKDVMGISKAGNINDEIYGSSGGYNPINDTVKAVNGSAVYELWLVWNLVLSKPECVARLNLIVKNILDDTGCYKDIDKQSFDDEKSKEGFKYLYDYSKKQVTDVEKVRSIVQRIEINGIMCLLSLKHQFSLIKGDKLNTKRIEGIQLEMNNIAKYCGLSSIG